MQIHLGVLKCEFKLIWFDGKLMYSHKHIKSYLLENEKPDLYRYKRVTDIENLISTDLKSIMNKPKHQHSFNLYFISRQ